MNEYLPLRDLYRLTEKTIQQKSRLELLLFFAELLKGLKYLHALQLIHGDIKPNNIFLTINKNNELQPMIADFEGSRFENELHIKDKNKIKNGPIGTICSVLYFLDTDYLSSRKCYLKENQKEWIQHLYKRDLFAMILTMWGLIDPSGITFKAVLDNFNKIKISKDSRKVFEKKCGSHVQKIFLKVLIAKKPLKRPSLDEIIDVVNKEVKALQKG